MKRFAENVLMIKWARAHIVAALLLPWANLDGQNIPIGSWRGHFSYNDVQEIIVGNGKIIGASGHGLFYINPPTSEFATLSKIDGFADVDITSLGYDEKTKTLVTAYSSGLIDLFSNGKVSTIRDLNRSLLADSKEVIDIIAHEGRVYAGCNFGVLEISIESKRIVNNFRFIGPKGAEVRVTEMIVHDNKLFAISKHGIQYGRLGDNLPDFNNWTFSRLENAAFSQLTVWEGKLYALVNNQSLARFNGGSWEMINSNFSHNIHGLIATEDGLYALADRALFKFEGNKWQFKKGFAPGTINVACYFNGFWYGHSKRGIETPDKKYILPNGPISDNMTKIRFLNNQLYGFYGMPPDLYKGQSDSMGYAVFDNSSWAYSEINHFYNISDGAYYNGRVYLSSVGYGIYDARQQTTLKEIGDNLDKIGAVIPQLAVHDRLFAISWRHETPLFIIDGHNGLTGIPRAKVGSYYPRKITVSNGGSVWMVIDEAGGGGVVAYDPSSEKTRFLSSPDGLPTKFVNEMAINLKDEAWATTHEGARIFADATSIPQNDSKAYSPIYENQELFANEDIKAIAFDGGDRPWIGTTDGLWIFDRNLSKIEARFDTENSPLPSHEIKDMAYNPNTGEMFILTDVGLVSYRSGSSGGGDAHANVNIFPNPVRPGYSGLVGISGLVNSAHVKVVDTNGKLVRSLRANGGAASWDLNDYNGQRAPTGVYIVFSSSPDGTDTFVGKIAIVN